MRKLLVGAAFLSLSLGISSISAAQEITSVATAAAASSQSALEVRGSNATVRLMRDGDGRWQRIETTRVELERIRRRSPRYRLSLYKAPATAQESALRMAGQKLANRERGTVAIVYAGGSQIMSFQPSQVAVPSDTAKAQPQR